MILLAGSIPGPVAPDHSHTRHTEEEQTEYSQGGGPIRDMNIIEHIGQLIYHFWYYQAQEN